MLIYVSSVVIHHDLWSNFLEQLPYVWNVVPWLLVFLFFSSSCSCEVLVLPFVLWRKEFCFPFRKGEQLGEVISNVEYGTVRYCMEAARVPRASWNQTDFKLNVEGSTDPTLCGDCTKTNVCSESYNSYCSQLNRT